MLFRNVRLRYARLGYSHPASLAVAGLVGWDSLWCGYPFGGGPTGTKVQRVPALGSVCLWRRKCSVLCCAA